MSSLADDPAGDRSGGVNLVQQRDRYRLDILKHNYN